MVHHQRACPTLSQHYAQHLASLEGERRQMNQEINKMLSAYALGTHISAIHALKEIIQALTLHTLSKTDFFSHAAFYGGTALRIFHGLDRFSEDMDFSLKTKDENFNLETYLPAIEQG